MSETRPVDKQTTLAYKFWHFVVSSVFPKYSVVGEENIPKEPCLMVGNHSQMYGPVAGELYTPGPHYIWCAGQMMHKEEVAEYAFNDFWSHKPKWQQPFWRLAAKLITPLAVCIFNGAHCVSVYHDHRLYSTFRETTELVSKGWSMVIFPERLARHNNILYDFQEGFVDVAMIIYKKTGRRMAFVPEYVCPRRHTLYFGKPIYFDPEVPLREERLTVKKYLMDTITDMATALPEHTVVPYENMEKRLYPKNRPLKEYKDEQIQG